MKTCFKCGDMKPLTEFYKHPQMADGRLNKCAECTRADVRQNRAAKLEYYREYDRQRADMPARVAARAAYAKTGQAAQSARVSRQRYAARDPVRRAAHILTGNAIRDGRLVRGICEVCGSARTQAHHDDYHKPLEVRWLCVTHHAEHHKRERAAKRATTGAAP